VSARKPSHLVRPGTKDHWEHEIRPYGWIEFKYTLEEGETIVFDWQASAPVHFDMHAHPFDGGTALTESYKIADAARMRGSYKAPFTGIHGWYWQNRTLKSVKLTLDAAGAITESTLFDAVGEQKRPIQAH